MAELTVLGYQFPEITDVAWDSDWLFLRFWLQWGEHRWERIDPVLTTFELERLALWLLEVAQHANVFGCWTRERLSTLCTFTEPNVAFGAYSGHPTGYPVTLRIYLTAELLPPFKALLPTSPLSDGSEVWMEFGVDETQLRVLAEQLQRDLERFPVRVGLHLPSQA